MNRLLPLAALLCITAPLQFASGEGQTQRIEMRNVAFVPAEIRVHLGDTVQWDNSDIAAHTATSKEGGFDVNVGPGRKGSIVAKRSGTFAYICRYHPNMKGQLIVDP
jgi:plastocyanin